jgi:hypothetical protein
VRVEALRGLAKALDVASRGTVVLGPEAAAGTGGLIASVRTGKEASVGVSTVDVADRAVGPLAVVLALAEQLRGSSGAYGVGPGARRLTPKAVQVSSAKS